MSNEVLFLLIVSSPVILYLIYRYLEKNNEKRRWAELDKEKFPTAFETSLMQNFRPYHFLSVDEKTRLKIKIQYFLKYKNFSSIGEFEIQEEMKLIIAAQACLLIINLEGGVYPTLKNIYLSAAPFINKENFISQYTMKPTHEARLGESWKDGPIVLSWSSVRDGVMDWRDGENVVLHEFTHQLDGHEGGMNGVPRLLSTSSYLNWKVLMTKEFFELRKKIAQHKHIDIDSYGSTNPSEFFAVTVEEFFERSVTFKNKHPELFKLYQDYFKINPLKWH